VASHASSFFIDGFDTSSTTLSHALFELAVNPDLLARLRVEVDAALAENDGKINYEMMQSLPYLDMIIAGKKLYLF
jgi:cytochrome P450 family 6